MNKSTYLPPFTHYLNELPECSIKELNTQSTCRASDVLNSCLQCSGVEKVVNVVVCVCFLCHKGVSSVCITARVQNGKMKNMVAPLDACKKKKKNASTYGIATVQGNNRGVKFGLTEVCGKATIFSRIW